VRARWGLVALFLALLGGLALGTWGTVVRPPAYELRGDVVARPAPDVLLVRHDAVPGLGMGAMALMVVSADPRVLDAAGVRPGARVRLAVRAQGDRLVVLRAAVLPP